MKCDNCFEEWNISDLGTRQIKYCPFCGVDIQAVLKFENVSECFKYLRKKYTYTIFMEQKKLLAYVLDYMPEITVEKRVLKVVLEAGIYNKLLDDHGNIVALNIEKAKCILADDYALSDKWACAAVDWLVSAFDGMINENVSLAQDSPINESSAKESQVSKKKTTNKINGYDNKGKYTYIGSTDSNGIPNGKGELMYESGNKYIGTFSDGVLVGSGKVIFSNGSIFMGVFKNGKQIECVGTLIEKNGDKYEGNFRKGLRKHGIMRVTKNGSQESIREEYENGHYIGRVN